MYEILFRETTVSLRSFLQSTLSQIADDWWSRYVFSSLTFAQQNQIKRDGITSLDGLDLAALLRLLDQNFSEIANRTNLPREAKTWTRELQSVRNRWAHAAGPSIAGDDLYRDLDTLQRLLVAIAAPPALIETIRERKQAALPARPQPLLQPRPEPVAPVAAATIFQPTDVVCLKADPSVIGAILQVLSVQPEERYLVFIGGKSAQYYVSQLLPVATVNTAEISSLDTFHAHLSALQLQHPGLANLYSLHAARIDYIPYQFKPVMKLIRSDRPRLLIADEVGVGKTIEAGLILRELQARRDLNSVLIICPRPLVTENKWRNEMKRFDEEFIHLDGPALRHCINETDLDGLWPEKSNRAILPFSLFDEELLNGSPGSRRKRGRKGLMDLDPPPKFDLVIVDEAHHLRNPNTWLHRGVRHFCENAEAVVFLTATPIQLGITDLFVQLNLLRPDLVIDQTTFAQMAAPNPFINQANTLARNNQPEWQAQAAELLAQAAETAWGRAVLQNNPTFQRLYDLLGDHDLKDEERVAFIRGTEGLHSFSAIINRTRRRDIGTFTTRKPETVVVPFTAAQQRLHDDLLAMQARILGQIHGDTNLLFMMSTIRRQAASCLYGLAPLVNDILTRRLDQLDLAEIDDTFDGEMANVGTLEDKIQAIMERAANLDPHDPKLEALLKILRDKEQLPNNKVLLFSSFRHTLAYLETHLRAAGLRIGYIHGNTPDEERREQRYRFSRSRDDGEALDILLSSEVGCEGLDYQFCDCLVNYDLPWNPMKVEQRIGRIDRYGQQSESVAIYNLITPGTVDADIYERCLWRIGVFQAALGGSEEILGKVTSEIRNIAENLELSPEERRRKLEIIADNEIRVMQEQAQLEEQQAELFGLRLPQQFKDEEVEQAESFWLTPQALQRLVQAYLEKTCEGGQEYLLGEKALKTLRLGQAGRDALLADFNRLPKKRSPLHREWELWLKGKEPHLAVTFDAEAAKGARKEVVFVTPIHPLAMQAARALSPEQKLFTAFRVQDAAIASGHYPFAIYQWQKRGVRDDVVFTPVCADAEIARRFMALLSSGAPTDAPLPEQAIFDALDANHYALWSAARAEHLSQNSELVGFRRESLRTSHTARMAILQEQLTTADNDKIRRMRQSQIDSAEADFGRHLAELERADRLVDIHAQPVAYGVMVVEGRRILREGNADEP